MKRFKIEVTAEDFEDGLLIIAHLNQLMYDGPEQKSYSVSRPYGSAVCEVEDVEEDQKGGVTDDKSR